MTQKPRYEELVRSNDTGEEVPFSLAQAGQYGQDFTIIGKRQVGVFVLIPGYVDKFRFKKDESGKDITQIKGLIAQEDRPDLERIVHEYRYNGDILYWEPEGFM